MKKLIWAVFLAAGCASASAQTAPLPMALCAGWQGQRVCENLHEDEQIRVLRCVFPPNVGHEPHFHPPHFGYVLEGGTVRNNNAETGARVLTRPADSTFVNDTEVRHDALNMSENPLRYLIIE